MGDSRYKDNLTTLAKRLRPLLLSIAEGAMNANEWDNIILIVADGGGTTYYPATGAGLTSALAASSSGDVIYLPSGTFSGNQTVAAGVNVFGFGVTSIVSGTVTNNGNIRNFKIVGNLVNNSKAYSIAVDCSSGHGIEQTNSNSAAHECVVNGKTGCTHMFYATNGRVWQSISGGDGVGVGIYANGVDLIINNCRFFGEIGGQIETVEIITNSSFRGAVGYDGLYHTTGTGRLHNCSCQTNDAGDYDVNLAAGGLTFQDVAYTTITGEANIGFGRGDRGNYSVEDYHAADIEAAALLRHLPSPVGKDDNNIAYVDTNVWVIGSAADAGITGDDEKVGVSANDTTPGYLNGKLVAGDNITLTEGSDGGDETFTVAAAGGTPAPTDAYWEPAVEAAGEELVWTDDGDIAMIWIS